MAGVADAHALGTVGSMTNELPSTLTTFTTLADCEEVLSYVQDADHFVVFLDAEGCPWYIRKDVYQDCYAGRLSSGYGRDEFLLTAQWLLEGHAPGRILYDGFAS